MAKRETKPGPDGSRKRSLRLVNEVHQKKRGELRITDEHRQKTVLQKDTHKNAAAVKKTDSAPGLNDYSSLFNPITTIKCCQQMMDTLSLYVVMLIAF